MASERTIKADIDRLVSTYSLWAIGVTDDPDSREGERGNPPGWHRWEAESEHVARAVGAHFVDRGMQDDSGRRSSSAVYVYIFMGLQARLEGNSYIPQENFGQGGA